MLLNGKQSKSLDITRSRSQSDDVHNENLNYHSSENSSLDMIKRILWMIVYPGEPLQSTCQYIFLKNGFCMAFLFGQLFSSELCSLFSLTATMLKVNNFIMIFKHVNLPVWLQKKKKNLHLCSKKSILIYWNNPSSWVSWKHIHSPGLKKQKIANLSSHFPAHLRCWPIHFQPHFQSLLSGKFGILCNHR